MLDQRGQLLRAALGFAGLPRPSYDRSLWALRSWLDSWSGIGRIAVGMAHQGYDLQLTRYDERGWRATFYTTGMEHSPTSATGTGWERTRWHATQRAAWGVEEHREGGRYMIRGLHIFGIVWLSAVVALVVFGNIAFLYFAESKPEALGKIRDDMSPFNISGWLVKLILAAPGLVALWLSERMKPRAK